MTFWFMIFFSFLLLSFLLFGFSFKMVHRNHQFFFRFEFGLSKLFHTIEKRRKTKRFKNI
jgi:hypothetical protein